MKSIHELQQERTHKALSAKDVITKAESENRPMTPDEGALFDKLKAEIDGLDAQIKALHEHAARAEQLAKLAAGPGRITQPDQPATPTPQATPRVTVPAMPLRARALKAFKNTEPDLHAAYRGGQWLRAAILRDERAVRYCQNNGVGMDIRNALEEKSNTNGGFLVPTELSQRIIDLRESYGVFRQNCFVQPMGRDSMDIPRRLTGLTIGAINENPSSAISPSNPTWNMVSLNAKKAGGLCLMSSEIGEDAVIDLADYVAAEFAYAFALFEDQCGFIGDQTSTYLGINGLGNILTIAGGLAGAVAAATATFDLFSEITTTDLAGVMGKLPEYARMNAKWYCSAFAREMVFGRLKAAAGGNNPQTLSGGFTDNYAGYPIVTSQVLPAGAATDYSGLPMLYFGDLSKSSTLGDRREIRIFASDHRYMDTDQIGIRGTSRFDIVNHDLGDTTTAGPVVALCGGAS